MAKDKKSKDADIEKLRMILDSPSDPKVRKIIAKHEKNLESIRERLSNEQSKTKIKYTTSDFLKKFDSLEPKVIIHEKEEKVPAPSEIEAIKTEAQNEERKDEFQDLFADEDLYEVEKVDVPEDEFLEVKPKEMEKIFEKKSEIIEEAAAILQKDEEEPAKEMHEKAKEIPEWEPVEETKPEEKSMEKVADEKEPLEEMHKKDEVLPEWEFVEETKSEEVEETVKGKEEPATKEFVEVTTVNEKIEIQEPLNETEEEIPTWEPIEPEKTKEGKASSGIIGKKIAGETSGEASEKKVEASTTAVKETKAERKRRKRKEKELKKKRKEEKKLKILEEKKSKREAKQRAKEIKKTEAEKKKKLKIQEFEQKKKQKEEEKQKKLKEKEEEVQMKAQLKNDKILAASEKKELKKSKKLKKAEKKLKKAEPKTPELKAGKELPFEEKIVKDTVTEWESYTIDKSPDTKPDTSVFTHGDFTLYKKEIKTTTGKKRTVHFFSKKTPDIGDAVQLPEGYDVKVNRRTGLPYLKKK